MAHDVFISCTAADKPVGDAICATLEQNGVRCWIAPRDSTAGLDEDTAIFAAIAASKMMVLVLSSRAEPLRPEIDRAVGAGIPIIPVRLQPSGSPWGSLLAGVTPGGPIAKLLEIVTAVLDQGNGSPQIPAARPSLRLVPSTPKSPQSSVFGIPHRDLIRPVTIGAVVCVIGGLLLAWQLAMDASSSEARRRASSNMPYAAADDSARDEPAAKIAGPLAAGKAHVCLEDYPAESARRGEQGTTILGFRIMKDGTTENIHVVSSSGFARLDTASVKCAATWRYTPATRSGDPIAVPWKAEVKWVLH